MTVELNQTPVDATSATLLLGAPTGRAGPPGLINLPSVAASVVSTLGLCVNPFMEISQENGTTLLTLASGTPKYGVDQMVGSFTGSMVIKSQQVANPFSATATFKRFLSSQQLSVTTSSALSAGHFVNLFQPIEGNMFKGMGWGGSDAAAIDVVAVVMASVTGTYSLYVQNAAAARSYVVPVSLTANTPAVVFATIPGDTSGTWPATTSHAVSIGFNAGAGSTFVAPANSAWQAGNYYAVSGNTNLSATLSATFTIGYLNAFPSGFLNYASASQVNLSKLASMRQPYDIDLNRCQRYWQASYAYGVAPGTVTQTGAEIVLMYNAYSILASPAIRYKNSIRPGVSVSIYNTQNGTSGQFSKHDPGDTFVSNHVGVTYAVSDRSYFFSLNANGTPNGYAHWQWVANSRIV